jgi:hypothetical protein
MEHARSFALFDGPAKQKVAGESYIAVRFMALIESSVIGLTPGRDDLKICMNDRAAAPIKRGRL